MVWLDCMASSYWTIWWVSLHQTHHGRARVSVARCWWSLITYGGPEVAQCVSDRGAGGAVILSCSRGPGASAVGSRAHAVA